VNGIVPRGWVSPKGKGQRSVPCPAAGAYVPKPTLPNQARVARRFEEASATGIGSVKDGLSKASTGCVLSRGIKRFVFTRRVVWPR